MNPISEENLHVSVKKFTRIMVGIAIGFVALYLFIFFQLKQTESQLTSYGNVTDSAIGNFLENLPESDSVKVEKTVNGITFIVKGGEGSSLNADLFDSKNSDYFLNATNITEGTLKDSVYSAWKDLEAEGVVSNGKIKPEFIPTTSGGTSTATNIDWNNIQNRPAGLDNGDDTGTLSEAQVEEYVTNAAINLASGTTLNGNALATESWVNSQNYLSGVNFSQITNNNGGYLDYRPNNTACAQGETLKYDAGVNRWICGTDIGAGSMTWGGISGTLSDQTDLVSALGNKLNTTASFGGDTTGTYDAIVVTNDSHDHTSASISGLTAADFSSTNISQWTNDAGFITNDTSVAKNEITNTGTLPFVWEMSELATQVIVEGEDISLLNNNAGYITGVNHSQVANSAGVYWNYRPNNTACAQDQVLKYDAGSSRWVCGTDASVGTISWGNITGSLADQIDLNNALNSKLDSTATFGGDVSGSYGNLQVAGESHDHTGATISGLSVADFTSGNVSQWTNDSGFITGLNHSQVSNSNGIYWDYRPNNTACAQDQVLKYDAGLNRWTCGTDAGSGSVTWGALTGTLSDQVDLNNALEGKLDESASFVGDVTGNYGATVVGNDSHDHTGSTISGLTPTDFTSANISQWTNDSGYITGVNFSEVSNGSGVYLNYKPNDVACDHGQTLKYDAGLTRWACGDDNGAGTIAWGDLTGNIADQGDLSTVLSSKLNLTANFGGDASGTYDNLQIANDSHAHTGASITGLGTANFTSDNISQWNNDAGFISGLDISQITNGAGKYFNYKPNDVACNDGGILEYDEGNARWICGVDNSSVGGGDVTVGSMTGSSLFMDSSADDDWLGLGTSAGKIEFDDQATDEILLMNANVGIGQATPTHTLDVNGNIGIAASGYLNFGATDGSSGYGFRDNAGVIEYKDSSGTWIPLNSLSGGGGGGGVVASVTTVQTRTQATYLAPNTGDGTEITPLTIVMTPKAAGNKVILEWYLNGESAQGASFIVTRNGTRLPDTTDVSNNRYANTATFPYDQDSNSTPDSFSVKIIDDNSLDVESTYRLFVRSSYATEPTFYLNRSIGSAGTDNFETSLSIGMATEIDPTPSGGGEVTVGSMTGSSLFMDSTADDDWLGLGVAAGRIEFDDQATDEILLMGANVGIGQSTPTHTLDVNGNIGLATSGYINFGATDGDTGYGIRDNAGEIEYKDASGTWVAFNSITGGGGGGSAIYSKWDPDAPPLTPTAQDDEFSDTVIDVKWNTTTGAGTVTESDEYLTVVGDKFVKQTLPAGDFTVWSKVSASGQPAFQANSYISGLSVQADAGTIYSIGFVPRNGSVTDIQVIRYSNYLTWSATPISLGLGTLNHGYVSIRRSSTTLTFWFSSDGVTYHQIYSVADPGVNSFGYTATAVPANQQIDFIRYKNSYTDQYTKLGGQEIPQGGGSASEVVMGSMTGTSLFMDASADDDWFGLGVTAARIEFDDQATDEILLMGANVGIGQSTPTHTLDVNGNIGLATSGYINFGATDGDTGYGVRDNGGVVEAKNASGNWNPIATSEPYILIRDEKPSGTQGGAMVAGSWFKRTLNTEVTDTANIASLSADQITLPAGTYRVNIMVPAMGVGAHRAKLYNVTTSSDTLLGTSIHALDGDYTQNYSVIVGEFTITQTTTFEVRHRGSFNKATWGLGHMANFGEAEIYTSAEFWKLSR